jgi:hypothetical protein
VFEIKRMSKRTSEALSLLDAASQIEQVHINAMYASAMEAANRWNKAASILRDRLL